MKNKRDGSPLLLSWAAREASLKADRGQSSRSEKRARLSRMNREHRNDAMKQHRKAARPHAYYD